MNVSSSSSLSVATFQLPPHTLDSRFSVGLFSIMDDNPIG